MVQQNPNVSHVIFWIKFVSHSLEIWLSQFFMCSVCPCHVASGSMYWLWPMRSVHIPQLLLLSLLAFLTLRHNLIVGKYISRIHHKWPLSVSLNIINIAVMWCVVFVLSFYCISPPDRRYDSQRFFLVDAQFYLLIKTGVMVHARHGQRDLESKGNCQWHGAIYQPKTLQAAAKQSIIIKCSLTYMIAEGNAFQFEWDRTRSRQRII